MRDRDLLDQRVLLQLPVRRVDCLSCGRVTERIDWLEPASRLTQRMRVWLEGLLQLLPISHVSHLTGLHWHTLVKTRFRGLAKNTAQLVTLFALSNLWMARRHLLTNAEDVRL